MKKIISIFIIFLLTITSFSFQNIQVKAQSIQQPNVTVKLVNYLGNVNELTIHFTGNYLLNNNFQIENGKTYRLRNENNTLVLLEGSNRIHTFNEFTFVPSMYNEEHRIRINNRPYLGTMRFIAEGSFVRPVNILPVEDYLKGVVPSEMPASWHLEALKAQAVAARTYVAMQGAKVIDDTINFQVYAGYAWHSNSTRAVVETSGQTLMHNGRYISAVYSSSNGGRTESNANVWGGTSLSYLPIKDDPYDSIDPWTFTINKTQIDLSNLNLSTPETWWTQTRERDTTIPNNIKTWLYNNGYKNTEIKIVSIPTMSFSNQLTSGGRVRNGDITVNFFVRSLATNDFVRNADGTIRLHTVEYKNTTAQRIRAMIGINLVRSYLVDSVRETSASIVVNGRGWGHGVGMSQWGAKGMADRGFKVAEILQFYYPGTTLTPFIQYASQSTNSAQNQITPLQITNERVEYDERNKQIIIRYTLNQDAPVTITIRDSGNRVVATLIRDIQRTAGNLAQFWSVDSIPNGTYYYTIEAKNTSGQVVSATVQHTLAKTEPQTTQPVVTQQPITEPVSSPPPTQPVTSGPVSSQPAPQPATSGQVSSPPPTQSATSGGVTSQPAPQPTPQQVTPQPAIVQPKPTSTSIAAVGTRVTGKVNVKTANIRKSASTSSAIVGRATLNQNVNILGRTGDFYQVQAGSVRGFIHVNLLNINQRLSNSNTIAVVINGRVANVEGNAVVRNNTVYVPLKGYATNLKMSYQWNKTTNRITVRDSRSNVIMNINNRAAKVNNKNVRLTNAPVIIHSRPYVSIRTLNETTQARTHWDSRARIVWISR
ncbi:MAG: SpoIID/LytB domain-containing protein [Bacillaceae bacterium]|nr:SpoIID/LytB domain-containing protein [Bacillaceae bacterium]